MMDAMITSAGTVVLKVDLNSLSEFSFILKKNSQNSLLSLHFSGMRIVLYVLHDAVTIATLICNCLLFFLS